MWGDGVGAKIIGTAAIAAVSLVFFAFSPAYSGTDGIIGDAPGIQQEPGVRQVSTTVDMKSSPDPVVVSALTITHASGLTRPPRHGITAEVKALLSHLSMVQQRKFERASSDFPAFCQSWERRLHDREVDNISHINWQKRDGYETATYVAYSQVEDCETKETSRGVPIGKLSYEEYNYYLVGKTVDQAKHAAPKLLGRTNTLEIFSWEKNRWFY
jgi:hypothetical protein